MTTAYTSLLGFALPVTGELSGTWGDTVNNGITSLLDSAIAGTTTLSADSDVTLTTTQGSSNTAREAILLWTAGGSATRTITAPAQSKIYTVINASSGTQSIILAGAGPTSGVTIAKGESALCAWNGSDFIKISNTAGPGTFTNLTVTGNTTLGDADTDTITQAASYVTGTQLKSAKTATNTLSLAAYDVDGTAYTNLITLTAGNTPTLALTSTGVGTINNMSIGATTASTGAFTTLSANSTVTLSGGTENGVAYLNGSKVLTTGSALVFDGTNLGVGLASPGCKVDVLAASNTSLSPTVRVYSNNLAVNTAISYDGIQGSGDFYIGSTSNSPVIFKQSNAEQMRLTSTSLYTASNINVGIGTSSPTMTASNRVVIDVNGTSSSVIAQSSGGTTRGYGYVDSTQMIYGSKTAIPLIFQTTETNRMWLDASGNLGVGVTPSAWASGYKAIQLTEGVAFSEGGGNTYLSNNWFYDGTNKYIANGTAAVYAQSGGTHAWYTAPSGTAGNAITFTQAMTLNASGNLCIGTTATLNYNSGGTYKNLSIDGGTGTDNRAEISLAGGGGGINYNLGRINFGLSSNTTNAAASINGYSSAAGASTGGNLVFSTASDISSAPATERARIDSSGNLLVGTTTLVSPNSGFAFAVGDGSQLAIGHLNANTGTYYAYFNYNGSVIGSITQNGTTGVLYNLTSDYRLKNDQQALTGAKDFIMALKPKKWQWWDGSGEGVGFVAHEFMEVAKYSGHGEKDAVDSDGKPVYQSIQPSSSEVMANLVSFIQEQQALITQLTARITALEGA